MGEFRAKTRGFLYPVGEDVARVRAAGGLSKLTQDALLDMEPRLRRVEIGEACDDMPADALARYLERGDIERVDDTHPALTAEDVDEFNAEAQAEKPVLGLVGKE